MQIVGPIFQPEKYGIALAEGSALRKPINEALLELYDDGTYEKIYAKWFSAPRQIMSTTAKQLLCLERVSVRRLYPRVPRRIAEQE